MNKWRSKLLNRWESKLMNKWKSKLLNWWRSELMKGMVMESIIRLYSLLIFKGILN